MATWASSADPSKWQPDIQSSEGTDASDGVKA